MIRVKICGITNLEDALVAARAGADFLGFVCYPRSSRYITPEAAGRIIRALREAGETVTTVGVFVNAPVDEIRRAMRVAGFDLVQLHGDESPEVVRALVPRAYKGFRLQDEADVEIATAYAHHSPTTPHLLIDAYHPHAYGGTGTSVPLHLARAVAARVPHLLLAGGLTPDNVVDVVEFVRPWGVDVSSGVERAPGKKDHEKVRAFVAGCKRARIRSENAEVNP